jgi:hypothetical protein
MQDDSWSFSDDVSVVYGYAFSSNDTLFLEIYFADSRPRVMIEFFSNVKGE